MTTLYHTRRAPLEVSDLAVSNGFPARFEWFCCARADERFLQNDEKRKDSHNPTVEQIRFREIVGTSALYLNFNSNKFKALYCTLNFNSKSTLNFNYA